jgi:hypothetical protein
MGSSLSDIESNYPAVSQVINSIGAWLGSSGNPNGVAACIKGSDENYHWAAVQLIIIMTTTGDPTHDFNSGTICVNEADHNIKMYGGSGWRTLVTWLNLKRKDR